jgi:hypothetical protein
MRSDQDYILFGWDLGIFFQRVRLGWHQIFWGDEVGLRDWFRPPVHHVELSAITDIRSAVESDSTPPYLAVHLDEENVLSRRISFPTQVEPVLDDVLASEVAALSPFPQGETCWSHSVTRRAAGKLEVDVIIAPRTAVESALQSARLELADEHTEVEIWASGQSGPVRFDGYGSDKRDRDYIRTLSETGTRVLLGTVGVILLCAMPSLWLATTADQMETVLSETIADSGNITRTRDLMQDLLNTRETAHRFHARQVGYGPLLHRVAALTPDSIFLNRLAVDGAELTLTGLAENAAEYQSLLANSDLFSAVNAPSAFVRDTRVDRERFILTADYEPVRNLKE